MISLASELPKQNLCRFRIGEMRLVLRLEAAEIKILTETFNLCSPAPILSLPMNPLIRAGKARAFDFVGAILRRGTRSEVLSGIV